MSDEPCSLEDHIKLVERVARLEERASNARRDVDLALAAQRWLWSTLIAIATVTLLGLGYFRK